MPRELQLCQRIFSWLEESEVKEPKLFIDQDFV